VLRLLSSRRFRVAGLLVALVVSLLIAGARWAARGEAWTARVPTWRLEMPATAASPAHEVAMDIPFHLDLPPHDAELTLRGDAAVPPEIRGRDLFLTIPYYGGDADLSVDGVRAVRVDHRIVEGFRSAGPLVYRIPAELTEASHVALQLQAHVRWSQSGWFDTVPLLTLAETRPRAALAVVLVNEVIGALGLAALWQLGLSYVLTYLLHGRRRRQLLFAIQVLAASYYNLYYWGFTQPLLGTRETAGLAVAITVATVVSVYLTHEQFGLGPPSWLWKLAVAGVAALAVGWSGPYESTRVLGPATVALVVVSQIVTLLRLVRRPSPPAGARVLFGAWIILGVATSIDGFTWLGLGDPLGGVRLACVGLALFGLVNGFLLGREHTISLDRSDALNVTLEERVVELEAGKREIGTLNEELQRQLGDRTQQLWSALALTTDDLRRTPTLDAGARVCGRYEVVRRLGRGGMGSVFEAVRLADGRRFALKIAHEQSGLALARIAREAHLASRVTHPNVVRIHDVDVEPAGFLFLVMEYVEGSSLRELRSAFADAAFAVEVLRQMAVGLAALHTAGIIHRDLKPENVIVEGPATGSFTVKLADFGISRLAVASSPDEERPALRPAPRFASHESGTVIRSIGKGTTTGSGRSANGSQDSSLTQRGLLVGTPTYVAPELAVEATSVEASSDMFSFGVMAFELLTGRLPFEGSAALRIAAGEAVASPTSLLDLRPDLPSALGAAIERCLALDPMFRPRAVDLARVLDLRPCVAA
jgi:hypothetical protein